MFPKTTKDDIYFWLSLKLFQPRQAKKEQILLNSPTMLESTIS